MPGFFDIFFRPAEPEPSKPKPKTVKKVKKVKKDSSEIDELRVEIKNLKERIPIFTNPKPVMKKQPEPQVEVTEPEDDEPAE